MNPLWIVAVTIEALKLVAERTRNTLDDHIAQVASIIIASLARGAGKATPWQVAYAALDAWKFVSTLTQWTGDEKLASEFGDVAKALESVVGSDVVKAQMSELAKLWPDIPSAS